MNFAVPLTDLSLMTHEVHDDVVRRWDGLMANSDFAGGIAVESFEHEWARYCQVDEAIGVASGTDALHLALRGLGIGPGDEVILPANTFVATAEAILLAGATPRFADVDDGTLLMTGETLAAAMSTRARAVIAVHLYGQMPDMDNLARAAEEFGLVLIEDAAQAHGASWRDRKAGSYGRAACFSFYPSKNLGAFGDAGAIVTSDAALAERLRRLRNHGRPKRSPHRHVEAATNSRLDALQAAVLSAKLNRLDAWTDARRGIVALYRQALLGEHQLRLVAEANPSRSACHLAVARVRSRRRAEAFLAQRAIQTAIHYPVPCHWHPPYRGFADRPLPVTERAAGEVLSLPLFPHMSSEQTSRVCDALTDLAHLDHGARVG